MGDLWEITKVWFITTMIPSIQISLTVSLICLGIVYLVGRMEGWVNSYRGRNSVYAISSVIFTWMYVYLFQTNPSSILEWVWVMSLHVSLSYLIYTIIFMRLYVRLDKVQDNKIGED